MRFVQSPSASTPNTKSLACKLRPSVPPASSLEIERPVATAGEGGAVAEVIAAALQLLVPKP